MKFFENEKNNKGCLLSVEKDPEYHTATLIPFPLYVFLIVGYDIIRGVHKLCAKLN